MLQQYIFNCEWFTYTNDLFISVGLDQTNIGILCSLKIGGELNNMKLKTV
jgi:hypothetical protein